MENFRAFRQARLGLPEAGLVLVAGANNVGKSALLSALDLVAAAPDLGGPFRHGGSDEPARVIARFTLEDEERAAALAVVAEADRLLAGGALASVEYIFEERQGGSPRLVEARGTWPSRGMLTLASTPWDPSHNAGGIGMIAALRPQIGGPPETLVKLNEYPRSGMFWLDEMMPALPEVRPLWDFLVAWRTRFFHFRALRPGTGRNAGLASEQVLQPSGQNLPAVLLDLQTNRPHLFADLRNIITQIVPDVGRLETPTAGGSMEVSFADPYRPGVLLNLKDLGTGVEQLLMTIVVGLTQAPPFALIAEEPETNLHPAAQRALLGLLQTWARDRLIVVATHSTVMLDWSPGGDRLWLVTREQGASHVASVDTEPLAVMTSLGVRLSDVLSAERVLIVEGPADEDVLTAWFPDLLRNPRVTVVQGGGGDNARHAELLAAWLSAADRLGTRRVLYVRDRDELPPSLLDRLVASQVVHVLDQRELENYLLDLDALTAVISSLQPDDSEPPTPTAIASTINQAAEQLRPAIIMNRVARQLDIVRLMDHTLRRKLIRDNADLQALTAAVVGRIPDGQQLREKIAVWWQEAENDVTRQTGDDLLKIAPGAEVIDAVFMRFLGRHFNKRADGVAVATTMSEPPPALKRALDAFLSVD